MTTPMCHCEHPKGIDYATGIQSISFVISALEGHMYTQQPSRFWLGFNLKNLGDICQVSNIN
jgi:hypothetical protein